MSGGFRVSDSTIETAARAAFEHDYRVMGREWLADRPPERYHQEIVRKALEAALPSLVAEIREQIASEIETVAAFPGDDIYAEGVRLGMARAAAHVREPKQMPARGNAG
jgi:hypothetical protein